MVTTRSADHQSSTHVKPESLTLRSKSENLKSPATILAGSTEPVSSSSRKKSKILVNVPPPRKRTRLSYDGVADSEDDVPGPDTLETGRPKLNSSSSADARAEDFEAQTDFISFGESGQTQSSQRPTEKVERNGVTASRTNSSTPRSTRMANGNHNRFDSEEPIGDPSLLQQSKEQAGPSSQLELSEEDDDDTPEAASTKLHPSSSSSKQRKKTRGQKSIAAQTTDNAESAQSRQALVALENTRSVQDMPPRTLAANLPSNDGGAGTEGFASHSAALESDDSNDQSFETAQTTRQKDAFATPEEGMSAPTSPIRPDATAARRSAATPLLFKAANVPLDDLSSSLALVNVSKSRTKIRDVGSTGTALPPKAGSTVEEYRRQKLQNRVDKASAGKRGGSFKLQEDWPGKRRKFAVGY